ncbi:probable serine/threonine-protein kinase DDB_G0272282 [Mangifera indica]|uniref:probable serine/threonine-protein kinase DDB_G0272282 n=1 Tax=Mangifera indica TaxID=29780 RepID=UPI001CFA8C40|nr:probable serine/threonine-protein kinase DDB_G0272282 [Mangifera indica]
MAIELESSGVSPRISFSHDFCQSDILPAVEPNPRRSNSIGIDFDFCVRKSFDQDSSSADELFSDGKILPTQVKKKTNNTNPAAPGTKNPEETKEDSLKRSKPVLKKETGDDNNHLEDNSGNNNNNMKQSSKSFWRFKRSSSLNCGSGYRRSLCPLPPLLHRSNSTGSAMNNSQKQASIRSSSHSSSTTHQKPPLKKNYGWYGNGNIHVYQVLNVPSGNFFGLGSIFSNGKDKNKKK